MKDRFGKDWSKIPGTVFWRMPHLGRRMFFRHVASAMGGYFLMPSRPMETIAKAAVTPRGTAKNCIFVLLTGAPSHTDTFDLKEGAWTPASFNPTSYGNIRFPQGLLPNIANHVGDMTIIRSTRAWATAHGIAQTWVQIGRNPVPGTSKIAPHIGSVVSMELGPKSSDRTLPPFISLNANQGPGSGYFPPETDPFYVSPNGGGLTNTTHREGPDALDRRYGLMLNIDTELIASPATLGDGLSDAFNFKENARKLMYNGAIDRIFNFDQNTRTGYGNTSFGNACVVARNLIRANMGTRFIQISFGSWDHHVNIYQAGNLPNMAGQLDKGLGALMTDLKNDGLLDSTLVVVMGEFGRTVGPLNSNNGRDHHQQQFTMLAGGGVKGGQTIGVTDATGGAIVDPGWSRQREIKPEDIEATIYSALGIDWTTVRHDDPLKRGFEYVPFSEQDLYGPVDEVFA